MEEDRLPDLSQVKLQDGEYWTLQHWCPKHDCPIQSDQSKMDLDDLGREYFQDDNRYCPGFSDIESAKIKEVGDKKFDWNKWYDDEDCSLNWKVTPIVVNSKEEQHDAKVGE